MASAAAVRQHYDSLALIYRAFWGDHIHHGLFLEGSETAEEAQVRLVEHCAALVKPEPGCRVLDVGCGHGATAIHLAKEFGCEVVGLTLSEKQAKLTRQSAERSGADGRVRFEVQDAESFEYPQEQFDLVWTMESSEHFAHKQEYLRHVARTLRPGGSLMLTAWTAAISSARAQAVARAFLCPELWPAEQYHSAIKVAGLQVRQCEDLSARVMRTWEICRARAQAAGPIVRLFPAHLREFIAGIDTILEAYAAGDLGYTVLTAQK